MRPETPATQQWTKDAMFKSNYSTLGGLIVMTVAATLFYASLKTHLSNIERRLAGVVYADDLDRFSVQLQLRNPNLKLESPTAAEVMRHNYTLIDPTNISTYEAQAAKLSLSAEK